jgi:hypothetical protein
MAKPLVEGYGRLGQDMNDQEILLRGRLNNKQRNRLSRLLDMMYTPRELAEEIGFNQRQVYRAYIPSGCPYMRDKRGRLWINGKEFCEWALDVYRKRELLKDEAFCLTCRKPVSLVDPIKKQEDRLVYTVSTCPECGRKLARILDRKKRIDGKP